jgi:tRNA threonylcarbamoyladenosine biosynthesis protein TsaB
LNTPEPLILIIETSETICSVCLSKGEKIIAEKQHAEPNSHATVLAVMVQEIFQENNLKLNELKAVAISAGPGSYTGLRIGASFAKGICYANNIPLIAISTLKAMALAFNATAKNGCKLLCPMIDARRMEVYTSVFDKKLRIILPEQPFVLQETSITVFDFENTVFFGSGADKILLLNPKANIYNSFSLNATHLVNEANTAFLNKQFVNMAYFEPNYIKAFYGTVKFSE